MRAQSKVIVCGRADWTLAPAERMLLSGPTIAPALIGMGNTVSEGDLNTMYTGFTSRFA
jgi:hypothetical protein